MAHLFMDKMEIINFHDINVARKIIDKTSIKNHKIIVIAKNSEFNRKILENNRVDVLVGLESIGNRDRLRERDSGLNQVLCKLAKQNEITIGIDFQNFKHDNDFKISIYLARMMQNIRLCNKYGVKMVVVNSDTSKKDLSAFLLTLGMSTRMAKDAVENSFNFK